MVCNQSPGMIDWLLELGAARVARPVLRGGGGSDATSLPNHIGAPRHISHGMSIPAVDARGLHVAERAGDRGVGRDCVQGDLRGRIIDVPRLQSQGRPIR
jgi:hypothetical protein